MIEAYIPHHIEHMKRKERPPKIALSGIMFDVDSTLSACEGIDILAEWKGKREEVAPLTKRAMEGELSYIEVTIERLKIIRPTETDLIQLGQYYIDHLTEGARELITTLHALQKDIFVMSGGYNPAINILCRELGINEDHVFANYLIFHPEQLDPNKTYTIIADESEYFLALDNTIPLWKDTGKEEIIEYIHERWPGTYGFIGDSNGDMKAGRLVQQFFGCTAVVARESVVKEAEILIPTLWDHYLLSWFL